MNRNFLWEYGMYFVSDWAILNDTTPKQLQRILSNFHHLTDSEIHLACILLESYHAVYRRDRLEQRRNPIKSGQARVQGRCLPPTPNQLHEIAQRINAEADLRLEPEETKSQLQALGKRLRQYCIYVRGRFSATAFLDEPFTFQWRSPNCEDMGKVQSPMLKRFLETKHKSQTTYENTK